MDRKWKITKCNYFRWRWFSLKLKIYSMILALIFLIILLPSLASVLDIPMQNTETIEYLLENIQRESGSSNIVTAVYLQTRVFDTLFETLLLLVSIVGVLHFAKEKGSKKW